MTTKFTKSDFTEGDLVKINGESDDGAPEEWIGEVVDINDPAGIVVCLLERTKEQSSKIWRFLGSETIAPVEAITEHVVPERPDGMLTRRTVKNAWEIMGFSVGVDDFCLKEDEHEVTLELGNVDTSSDEDEDDEDDDDEDYDPGDACDEDEEISSDEECDDPTLGGFIVADEEEDGDDDFVADTHNAVNDWEDWQPRSKRQRRFKRSVDALAQRAAQEADDAAFQRGEAASVRPPPKRKRRKKKSQ